MWFRIHKKGQKEATIIRVDYMILGRQKGEGDKTDIGESCPEGLDFNRDK